jgi:hypothetical protein
VPAGSSGGTASAIAANLGIIGMGTDTGNSIRRPPSPPPRADAALSRSPSVGWAISHSLQKHVYACKNMPS